MPHHISRSLLCTMLPTANNRYLQAWKLVINSSVVYILGTYVLYHLLPDCLSYHCMNLRATTNHLILTVLNYLSCIYILHHLIHLLLFRYCTIYLSSIYIYCPLLYLEVHHIYLAVLRSSGYILSIALSSLAPILLYHLSYCSLSTTSLWYPACLM